MYWAKLMIENKMALSNIQETSSTTRNDASEKPAALHTSTRYIRAMTLGGFFVDQRPMIANGDFKARYTHHTK